MKYKMIVSDMDDTLLNSSHQISKKNKDAILKAQEAGIIFVLASGRASFAMREAAKELQLDKFNSYILSYNGSVITECRSNKILFSETLTKEEIHRLYDFSKEKNVEILTFIDDTIVSESCSEYVQVEMEISKMPFNLVENFKTTVDKDCIKCILLAEPNYLAEVEKEAQKKLGNEFSISISKPFFLEAMKLGINKGESLLKLAKILNIKPEEIIVIGDSYNDIPMLEVAGLPTCVANAKPEVKSICKFISTSNDEDAIATLINEFIFNEVK